MTGVTHPELVWAARFFTRDTGIMDGISLACGVGDHLLTAMDGEGITENTVFDLASVTKLFTGLCAMCLKQEGLLDFSRPVADYDPRFRFLRSVSVGQLMAFAVCVRTPVRLDACATREEARQALFDSKAEGEPGKRAYSDIPAMILKYVLEAASGRPLAECVRQRVLAPAGMEETWARVPEERLRDCLRYGPEYRLEQGRRILRPAPAPGVPHDPKAGLLQGNTGDLCGHAGLFSTRGDLVRFCRAVMAGKILSREGLREMAVNRTGRRLPDGTYTQFLGYQCYLRHPDQYFSEIPAYMGQGAFGIAGFTGNHLSVDPARGVFCLMLGNRVRGRLTALIPEEGKTLADYGLAPDGLGRFRWEPDTELPSSVNYVHQKDAHLHRAVAAALGLSEIPFGS